MRFLWAAAALALCSAASVPAHAQSGRPFDWSGFYVGAHGGWLNAQTTYPTPATPKQNFDGALIGAQIGYNLQFGRIVLGAEADLSSSKITDFIRDGNYLTEAGKIDALGTVRARLGYDFNGFLPFITAGVLWDRLQQNSTCPAGAAFGVCAFTGPFSSTSTQTFSAFTWGGGAEVAISKHWSIKGEVLTSKLDTRNYTGTIPVFGTVTTAVTQDLSYTARLGVNYRF